MLAAVINTQSGSVPAGAADALGDILRVRALKANIQTPDPDKLANAVEVAIEKEPDALIVWGGDGTIACALERAGPHGPPILPLPGGTMNLLPKRVHQGETNWRACLEGALDRGSELTLNAGRVGDRTFFVAAIAGRLSGLARPREALREGRVIDAARSLVGDETLDLEPTILVEADGRPPLSAVAAGLFVADGSSPGFEIGLIQPQTHLELAGVGLQAALQGWRDAEGVDVLRHVALQIRETRDDKMTLTLDGEPVELPNQLRFEARGSAARVLAAGVS